MESFLKSNVVPTPDEDYVTSWKTVDLKFPSHMAGEQELDQFTNKI